jgi:hypothetical protein
VSAVAAAQPQEAVGQDPAFEEDIEFVPHNLRQVGGACSGPGRRPAPAGAAGQWLAREAAEVVNSDGLKPRATAQSPCVPLTWVCPLLRGYLRGPVCLCDRPLRGSGFKASYVADGSTAVRRLRDQDARQPTLKSGCWIAAFRLLTVTDTSGRSPTAASRAPGSTRRFDCATSFNSKARLGVRRTMPPKTLGS